MQSQAKTIIAASFLLAVFLFSNVSVVYAQQLTNPGILPDSPLYGFKRFFENVQVFLTFDPDSKAKLHLQLAETRLAELNETLERGENQFAATLSDDYNRSLNASTRILDDQQAIGRNETELGEHVANETFKHILVLQDVLEKAPVEAQEAIERAINASLNGHDGSMRAILNDTPDREVNLALDFENRSVARIENDTADNMRFNVSLKVIEKETDLKMEGLQRLRALGRNTTALEEHVRDEVSKQLSVLQGVLARSPSHEGIENAINASSRVLGTISGRFGR